jgi:diaminohydroxyphosphoribosylaminopyrimidine deaminase/5-amino-6-(5-phosphoribosylamino)uracil reductase
MSNPIRFNDADSAMHYAIECAKRGLGHVEPNPTVGAIIVENEGQLLAEGWHKSFGGPHAEIECLNNFTAAFPDESVRAQLLNSSTMYVTLEPCCHTGKTGPCSQALIASNIRSVVIGAVDPSPQVDSGGIAQLKSAGIQVTVGVLAKESQRLIQPFAHLVQTNRPWVHAKWAMTLDGKIATRTGSSQWISNEESRAIVHQLRGRMDAIIVGAGTARADNPTLTARPPGPRIATRIVLDSNATLQTNSNLVNTVDQGPVLVVCSTSADAHNVLRLQDAGIEVLQLPASESGAGPDVGRLLDELGSRSMTHVLVEGGATLLGSFFDQDLVNEAHVFVANKIVGGHDAVSPVAGMGAETVAAGLQLDAPESRLLGTDIYINGVVASNKS